MREIDHALFNLEKKFETELNESESKEISINVLYGMAFTLISSREILYLNLVDNGLAIDRQGSAIMAIGTGIIALCAAGLAVYKIIRRYQRIGKFL